MTDKVKSGWAQATGADESVSVREEKQRKEKKEIQI